jgi:hypothetical protein
MDLLPTAALHDLLGQPAGITTPQSGFAMACNSVKNDLTRASVKFMVDRCLGGCPSTTSSRSSRAAARGNETRLAEAVAGVL